MRFTLFKIFLNLLCGFEGFDWVYTLKYLDLYVNILEVRANLLLQVEVYICFSYILLLYYDCILSGISVVRFLFYFDCDDCQAQAKLPPIHQEENLALKLYWSF